MKFRVSRVPQTPADSPNPQATNNVQLVTFAGSEDDPLAEPPDPETIASHDDCPGMVHYFMDRCELPHSREFVCITVLDESEDLHDAKQRANKFGTHGFILNDSVIDKLAIVCVEDIQNAIDNALASEVVTEGSLLACGAAKFKDFTLLDPVQRRNTLRAMVATVGADRKANKYFPEARLYGRLDQEQDVKDTIELGVSDLETALSESAIRAKEARAVNSAAPSRWDLEELIPEDGIFTGSASVVFTAPDGEIAGPGTLTLLPDGHSTLRIDIERYAIPPEYHHFLMPFVRGEAPEPVGDRGTTFRDRGTQKIKSVHFETPYGVFRATRALISKSQFGLFEESKSWIELVGNDLEFVAGDIASEQMWCMPLFGNLSEFRGSETLCSIADHVPFVAFVADGKACGVQILTPGESPYCGYSGIVFGEIGSKPSGSGDEARQLVPWGLIPAISFATGCDIRAPWVELRGTDGRLIRRLHFRAGGNHQEEGFPAFSRYDSARGGSGIGGFLNCFFALPEDRRARLIAPMNLTRSGTPGSATVDESIADLVKALDAICKSHGLARQHLMSNLDAQNALAVQQMLESAREGLKGIRKQCSTNQKTDQLAVLDRIISRQANVASDDLDFGVAVMHLLRRFDLNDSEVMNVHYSRLGGAMTWEGLLSAVRGEVIHSGAIRVRQTGGLQAWFEFARHLHDICKRIILRDIRYSGTYAPSNVRWEGQYELDRIRQTSTVADLGYTAPPVSI